MFDTACLVSVKVFRAELRGARLDQEVAQVALWLSPLRINATVSRVRYQSRLGDAWSDRELSIVDLFYRVNQHLVLEAKLSLDCYGNTKRPRRPMRSCVMDEAWTVIGARTVYRQGSIEYCEGAPEFGSIGNQ